MAFINLSHPSCLIDTLSFENASNKDIRQHTYLLIIRLIRDKQLFNITSNYMGNKRNFKDHTLLLVVIFLFCPTDSDAKFG